MPTQNKWNKELFYSIIFFIAAIVSFFLLGMLIDKFSGWVNSPTAIDIAFKLTNLGVHSFSGIAFNVMIYSMIIIPLLFLLGSIYKGIRSLKKAPASDKRKMFGFIPQSIPGFLAALQVFVSSLPIIMMIIGFFFV